MTRPRPRGLVIVSPGDVRQELRAAVAVASRLPRDLALHGGGTLADHLYTHWYSRDDGAHHATPDHPPRLVGRLRAVLPSSRQYDPGWHAVEVGVDGTVTAARGAESMVVSPPDYVSVARPAVPVRRGDPLLVTRLRDHLDLAGGWWSCDGGQGPAPPSPMVRVYLSCGPHAAVDVVASVHAAMEATGQPFSMKCPSEPRLFGRADAVVVYCTPDTYRLAQPDLRQLHRRLAPKLEDRTPRLALRLGRGVAVAEDPMDGTSFGQSRCAAVAEGLRRGWAAGVSDPIALADLVRANFPAHGIDAARPHLRLGSPPTLLPPW